MKCGYDYTPYYALLLAQVVLNFTLVLLGNYVWKKGLLMDYRSLKV